MTAKSVMVYTCNRCKEAEEATTGLRPPNWIGVRTTVSGVQRFDDLCPACSDAFMDFLGVPRIEPYQTYDEAIKEREV